MARWAGTDPEKWVGKVKERNRAVVRFAIDALAEEAQTPREQGGLLPVDIANLRNSFASEIGQMPSGLSEGNTKEWDAGALILTLARIQPGDTVFLGWTAKYARPMEARYGYMKSAAMGWQGHVDKAVQRAKAANP